MAESASPVSLDPLDRRISYVNQQFSTTLEALREFLDAVSPHVQKIDTERTDRLDEIFDRGLRRISPKDVEVVATDMETLSNAMKELAEFAREPREGKEVQAKSLTLHPETNQILAEAMLAFTIPPKYPILMRSLLPMGVGAFEVLVGELAGIYLRNRPGLLGTDAKEFSLDDLKQFDSIEDASQEAIQRRVDALLIQGLDEWAKWFSRRGLDINLDQLAVNWATTVELFQRRHIIVHNAGRVSKRYLRVMENFESTLPTFGVTLNVDEVYLERAIDNLSVIGTLLISLVWRNLDGDVANKGVADLLDVAVKRLMKRSRWEAARKLCEVSKTFRGLPAAALLMFKCGEWYCTKKISGVEEIREQVQNWDTSALAKRFKAIRLILLDRTEEAVQVLNLAISSGELSQGEVYESPMFSEVTFDSQSLESVEASLDDNQPAQEGPEPK